MSSLAYFTDRHRLALSRHRFEDYLRLSRSWFESMSDLLIKVERTMVSKCVNPACDVKFTYFGTGELLVKVSPATGYQELFWLCQRCATEWPAPIDLIPLDAANPQQRNKKNAAA